MLQIHRAEHAEPLVHALGELLAQPDGDPFAAEVVAVPSRGVERWLAQRLSHVLGAVDGDGVCANVEFPPSSEVLDAAAAAGHEGYATAIERWSPERAVWPLIGLIEEAARSEQWAGGLAAHLGLSSGQERGRRFTVAAKLARYLARYSRARPAMIRSWRAGHDDSGDGVALPSDLVWQARLWRRLRDELGPAPAELLDDACAALRDDPSGVTLPERVSIFGLTRLSPARVEVLRALAAHRDVHLWLPHPSPALWEAVAGRGPVPPGPRRLDPAGRDLHNPLLASLSRDVRELQALLTPIPCEVDAPPHRPPPADAARPAAARARRRRAPERAGTGRTGRPQPVGTRLPRRRPAGRGHARGRARAAARRPHPRTARHPDHVPGRRGLRPARRGEFRHGRRSPAGTRRPGCGSGSPTGRRGRPTRCWACSASCSSSAPSGSPPRSCSTSPARRRSGRASASTTTTSTGSAATR